jgi:hypothetical protein
VTRRSEAAAAADDRHVGRYGAQLADALVMAAGVVAGQRVLDVGCGPGSLTMALAGVAGADHVAGAALVNASDEDFGDLFVPLAVGAGNSGSVYRELAEPDRERRRAKGG